VGHLLCRLVHHAALPCFASHTAVMLVERMRADNHPENCLREDVTSEGKVAKSQLFCFAGKDLGNKNVYM